MVGSSWTKGADSSAPAIEQVKPKRSKLAGKILKELNPEASGEDTLFLNFAM